jgi:hypothetical protein
LGNRSPGKSPERRLRSLFSRSRVQETVASHW